MLRLLQPIRPRQLQPFGADITRESRARYSLRTSIVEQVFRGPDMVANEQKERDESQEPIQPIPAIIRDVAKHLDSGESIERHPASERLVLWRLLHA